MPPLGVHHVRSMNTFSHVLVNLPLGSIHSPDIANAQWQTTSKLKGEDDQQYFNVCFISFGRLARTSWIWPKPST